MFFFAAMMAMPKKAWKNLTIYAEFWAATDTNSGIFVRATDPQKISADSSYDVNIQDNRPDLHYGTGAFVNFAKATVPLVDESAGRWNTIELTAIGQTMMVKLNGAKTGSLKTVNLLEARLHFNSV